MFISEPGSGKATVSIVTECQRCTGNATEDVSYKITIVLSNDIVLFYWPLCLVNDIVNENIWSRIVACIFPSLE